MTWLPIFQDYEHLFFIIFYLFFCIETRARRPLKIKYQHNSLIQQKFSAKYFHHWYIVYEMPCKYMWFLYILCISCILNFENLCVWGRHCMWYRITLTVSVKKRISHHHHHHRIWEVCTYSHTFNIFYTELMLIICT